MPCRPLPSRRGYSLLQDPSLPFTTVETSRRFLSQLQLCQDQSISRAYPPCSRPGEIPRTNRQHPRCRLDSVSLSFRHETGESLQYYIRPSNIRYRTRPETQDRRERRRGSMKYFSLTRE